jgi:hypothetical protein
MLTMLARSRKQDYRRVLECERRLEHAGANDERLETGIGEIRLVQMRVVAGRPSEIPDGAHLELVRHRGLHTNARPAQIGAGPLASAAGLAERAAFIQLQQQVWL